MPKKYLKSSLKQPKHPPARDRVKWIVEQMNRLINKQNVSRTVYFELYIDIEWKKGRGCESMNYDLWLGITVDNNNNILTCNWEYFQWSLNAVPSYITGEQSQII